MLESTNGRAIIVASVLVSFSIIGGSFFVASSLNDATGEIERATAAIESLELAAAPPTNRPSRPRGDDPNRKFDVKLGDAPVKGGEDAVVTIIEFSDFQCPFCSRVTPTLAQIEKEYGDKVRFAFKHMPLPGHSQAPLAHAASEAAHRQGKFWEMHDRIFANPRNLSSETFEKYADSLGLNLRKFRKDMEDSSVKQKIAADLRQANELGVTGTPAFFINGKKLSGAQPFPNFKRAIDQAIAQSS